MALLFLFLAGHHAGRAPDGNLFIENFAVPRNVIFGSLRQSICGRGAFIVSQTHHLNASISSKGRQSQSNWLFYATADIHGLFELIGFSTFSKVKQGGFGGQHHTFVGCALTIRFNSGSLLFRLNFFHIIGFLQIYSTKVASQAYQPYTSGKD